MEEYSILFNTKLDADKTSLRGILEHMTMESAIIGSHSQNDLQMLVDAKLADGWELDGEPYKNGKAFIQKIIRSRRY